MISAPDTPRSERADQARRMIGEALARGERYCDAASSVSSDKAPLLSAALRLLAEAHRSDPRGFADEVEGDLLVQVEDERPTYVREAAKAFERALTRRPADRQLGYKAALAHQRAGAHAKAIKLLARLIAESKNDTHLYYLRGLSYSASVDDARARKELTKAIDLNPRDARYFIARAEANATAPRSMEERVADCDSALALDDGGWSHLAKAEVLYEGGSYDSAIEEYTRTIERDPSLGRAWEYRGQSLARVGRHEESARDLGHARSLSGDDPASALEGARRRRWRWRQAGSSL